MLRLAVSIGCAVAFAALLDCGGKGSPGICNATNCTGCCEGSTCRSGTGVACTPGPELPDGGSDGGPDAGPDGGGGDAGLDAGPGPFTLSVTRSGGGTVADSLGKIFCDERCAALYTKGTQLQLTATPDIKSRFLGWSGDCTGTGLCSLRLDSNQRVAATFSSCPGAVLWSRGLGGGGDDQGHAVAVDASGNAVVVGSFAASADLGGGSLTSAGGKDVFVAKYGPGGAHLWSKRFGGFRNDEAHGVVLDSAGDVIITGSFQDSISFGGASLASAGYEDIFVAKLRGTDGAHVWSQRFGSAYRDSGIAVAVNAAGDVAVTGNFYGAVPFGSTTLASAGSVDLFVIKLAATTGAVRWARQAGFTSYDTGKAVAFDHGGDVVVAGQVSAHGPVPADVFLAKYAGADGTPLWSHTYGGDFLDRGSALAIDSNNQIVLAGEFTQNIDFDGGSLTTAPGVTSIFLARFDPAGVIVWVKQVGAGTDQARALALDASGNIFLGGNFTASSDFGGGSLLSAHRPLDAFVAKYSAAGGHLWSQRFGGPGEDTLIALAADPTTGGVLAVGSFEQVADFCGPALVSAGGKDVFILKLGAAQDAATSLDGGLLLPAVPPALAIDGGTRCVPPGAIPAPPPFDGRAPVFVEAPFFPDGGGPNLPNFRAAVGDVDGDGRSDLILGENGFPWDPLFSTHLRIFHNLGNGTFNESTTQILGGRSIETDYIVPILVLDIDGDGRSDIFVGNIGYDAFPFLGTQAVLLQQQTDGTLRDVSLSALPIEDTYVHSAASADVDCDGHVDIFENNLNAGNATDPRLLMNDGSGHFRAEETLRIPRAALDPMLNGWTATAFCDVNRDGAPDLILGSSNNAYHHELLINDGFGRFTLAPAGALPVQRVAGEVALQIACVDLDLDGWPDLVVASASNNYSGPGVLSIWLNQRDGTFLDVSTTNLPVLSGAGFAELRIADLNGDGWPDIVVSSDTPHVLINQGGARFTEVTSTALPSGSTCSTLLPILADADAKIDLLCLKPTGLVSTVLLNKTP